MTVAIEPLEGRSRGLPSWGLSTRNPSRSKREAGEGDRGAALVEFAIVAPLLFLLIFAMIDFGWLFFQNLDNRHAARETARLAAVAYGSGTASIVSEACTRDEGNQVDIVIDFQGSSVGSEVLVTVQQPFSTLAGFTDNFIPVTELESTVSIRLEQPAPAATFTDEPDEASYGDCP